MTVKILKPDKSYVVYDGKSGKIVHIHSTVSLPGASGKSESESKSEALNLAQSVATSRHTGLKVLVVDPELLGKNPVSRVDLKKQTLVSAKKKRP